MNIIHAKSPCCQEKIYHYGNRRRQCSSCRKTWRIRKKKRGRKYIRVHSASAIRYLQGDRLASSHLVRSGKKTECQIQYRLKRSRDKFLDTSSWITPPKGFPLIAVADAIWQWINEERYTLHIILLKPLNKSEAIICAPLLRKGDETLGWPTAFSQLPQEWKTRIFALVCDGNSGLVSIAHQNKWITQRCHAHLRRLLNNYLRTGHRGTQRVLAKEVHDLVTTILICPDRLKMVHSVLRLKEIYHLTKSRGIRRVISGLIKHIPEYRTYLNYPEIDLPITTNAAESLNNIIRDLQRRTRGFRSPASFLKWVNALLLNKKTIVCNGHFSTK